MPIRIRILLACLSLTAITLFLGVYSYQAQHELGRLGVRIYDDNTLSISYLRSAQFGLSDAETRWRRAGMETDAQASLATLAALTDIRSDLDVAHTRAMSPKGSTAVDRVREDVRQLADILRLDGPAEAFASVAQLETDFTTAIEVYAADGFRYRRDVSALAAKAGWRMGIAVAVSVIVALVITVLLSRSIVPPLHKAFAVAQAIASGRLDNHIEASGRGEAAQLLQALGAMQSSIATGMQRIQALMQEQTLSHAGEIEAEHAKLGAALDNMTQGLCLFGDDGRLLVANRRFAEMFGAPEPGTPLDRVLCCDDLKRLRGPGGDATADAFTCTLDDGRVIAVCRRRVAHGGWVETYEDVTERHAATTRLAHMARHDALTELPNRQMLSEHMIEALARARRHGSLAVLCLDLDRFKAVNDALGHAAGDALLRAVAQRLRDCTRESDLIVRLGSDEFAIIQERSTQPSDSANLARRLIGVLSKPFEINQQRVTVSVSIGIALSDDGLVDSDVLLKRADVALHRAKSDGRGVYRYFEAEMDAEAQARRTLELDLGQALANGEFEMFYQPLLVASTCDISGFEALLRWRHPTRGLISPGLFIPIAEDIGLIAGIGEWVLRQACADAATWPGALKVAVNLSPVQFHDRALVSHVTNALARSKLPAERLELEITESVLLQNDEAVLATLHKFHALGARVALDDFGTGYSSLSYLRRFPFDKIKIDQSFIRSMPGQGDCSAIIRAIIKLGHSLGMTITAEGVETAEQLALLQAEGCDEVQGFLFNRPEPAKPTAKLLDQRGESAFSAHRGRVAA